MVKIKLTQPFDHGASGNLCLVRPSHFDLLGPGISSCAALWATAQLPDGGLLEFDHVDPRLGHIAYILEKKYLGKLKVLRWGVSKSNKG